MSQTSDSKENQMSGKSEIWNKLAAAMNTEVNNEQWTQTCMAFLHLSRYVTKKV